MTQLVNSIREICTGEFAYAKFSSRAADRLRHREETTKWKFWKDCRRRTGSNSAECAEGCYPPALSANEMRIPSRITTLLKLPTPIRCVEP